MASFFAKRPQLWRWLALILALGTAIIGQSCFALRQLIPGLIAYAASALLFIALLGKKQEASETTWNKRLTILAVILIALGLLARFYRLGDIPPGCWIDEAINGLDALEIIRTGKHQLYLTSQSSGRAPLFVETLTLPLRLGIPPSTLLVRAVAALIGSLGLVFYFFLLKTAFSARVALIGAAFLAFSHWHNNYSRWGVEIIMSPTFQALGLWLFFAGLKSGKKWLFALSGAALGLGLYTYQNYRVFLATLFFFALYLLVFHRQTVKRHWQGLALFVLAGALLALPEGIFALSNPKTFADRAMQTVVWLGAEGQPAVIRARLSNSIRSTLLAFQYQGDENGRHNLPGAPLLTFVPAMFLPLGILISLSRFRRMEYALALLWFFFGVLPGAITWEAPHASRLLDAISASFIFAALGLEQAWITLEALWPRPGARLAALLASAALLITALANLNITFVLKPASQQVYEAFLPMESLAGELVRGIGDTREMFLSDKFLGSAVVRFIGWDAFHSPQHQIAHLNPLENAPLRTPVVKDVSYLLDAEFTPFLPALRYVYPGGEEIAHRDKWGEVRFYEYRVSQQEVNLVIAQGALQSPFGLEGSFYADASGQGTPFLTRIFPFLRTDFAQLIGTGGAFKLAIWRGTLTIPVTGIWVFTLNPANTSLQIGDKLVIQNMGDKAHEGSHDGVISLQAGEYPVEIRYTPARDSRAAGYREIPRFLWFRWTPPGKMSEWVPSDMMRSNATAEATSAPSLAQATPTPAATPLPQQSVALGAMQVWGSQGKGKAQFQEPRDVAVGKNGLVYVADTGNHRVLVFDSGGEQKAQWTRADQPLVEPISMVINRKGEVLVLDIEPAYIYRFAENGDYLGKFAGPESKLYKPRGMSLDATDNVYVADTGGCRIVKFDASGQLIAEFGGRGAEAGQLLEPTDVAVTSNGDMFVADSSNRRIQHWTATGVYLGEWPIPIANAYYGPHITVAADDTLLVTMPELGQIWRYSTSGEVLAKWGETAMWRMPVELAISGKTLYVVAAQQHQILRFALSNP